ncbi:uncharacterized protein EAF01_009707 [Botrytis porri]|uniref:Uncharacterized protein n=1 Tax=Botrytis porri TaxID=87229 RepID=A0A4Z1KG85_9HELO|nr:uncharacterized protein EAF01_009707 [Botrytis porri]KAF7895745.1 hypothetical protein EAF01_009707 [Botrytis porri]TGO85071.1 hypothetical protein BPOR_0434g00020 [Botrytis porri]
MDDSSLRDLQGVGLEQQSEVTSSIPLNLAFTSFLIENLFAWFWMIGIQYFLFKVLYQHQPQNRPRHRSEKSLRPSRFSHCETSTSDLQAPSPSESYLLITFFWLLHALLHTLLIYLLNTLVSLLSTPETTSTYLEWRSTIYNLHYWVFSTGDESPIYGFTKLLVLEVLFSWFLSQVSHWVMDTIIPFLGEVRGQRDFRGKLRSAGRRTREIYNFILHVDWSHDFELSHSQSSNAHVLNGGGDASTYHDENPNRQKEQIIELSRQRSESLSSDKGTQERKLDWKLIIDASALNEMKEMLGPPGGFGELGFSVAKDRVCLGAVSSGSSFMVTFGLEGSEGESGAGSGDRGSEGKKGEKRERRRGTEIRRNT